MKFVFENMWNYQPDTGKCIVVIGFGLYDYSFQIVILNFIFSIGWQK